MRDDKLESKQKTRKVIPVSPALRFNTDLRSITTALTNVLGKENICGT